MQFVLDESGSMARIRGETIKALNEYLETIRESTKGQDVFIRVTTFGGPYVGPTKELMPMTAIEKVKPVDPNSYNPSGGTPLFDAVGEATEHLSGLFDAGKENVAFLLITVTDGGENQSVKFTGKKIQTAIEKNQKTDRWTYAFLCPPGGARELTRFGIHPGNVKEWEATTKGVTESSIATRSAMGTYFTGRSMGVTSTQTFYTDLSKVSKADLKELDDITSNVKLWEVKDEAIIREFVESKLKGSPMLKGSAFYQLMKTEKNVQDYKKIALVEKKTKKVLFGDKVRSFLGLPQYGDVKVEPGNHGDFDVFVQSTSTNRKLPRGSKVLYYEAIGVPYTEGPSAR